MKRWGRVLAAWGALVCILGVGGAPQDSVDTAKTPYVSRPTKGLLIGYVVDAKTKKGVAGVQVTAEVGGTFTKEGATTCPTDAQGRYSVTVPMGYRKKTTKVNFLSAVFTVLVGTPLDVQRRREEAIHISQASLKAEKSGYQSFLGTVRISHVNAKRMRAYMDNIVLSPSEGTPVSFAETRSDWEKVLDFSVNPPILAPGEEVRLSAKIRLPRERAVAHDVGAFVPYGLFGKRFLVPMKSRGKPSEGSNEETFTASLRVPRSPKTAYEIVSLFLARDGEDILGEDAPRVLLTVLTEGITRSAAEDTRRAFELWEKDELDEALQAAQKAASAAPDYPLPRAFVGNIAMALNRYEEAAAAFQDLVALDQNKLQATKGKAKKEYEADLEWASASLATALLEAGQGSEALAILKPLDKDPPALESEDKEAAQKGLAKTRMSTAYNIALGRCYLAEGDLKKADVRLKRAGTLPAELRSRVALERAQAALAAAPRDASAVLGVGRALGDCGRWDEAVAEMERARQMDASDPWVCIELSQAYAEGLQDLDRARQAAEEAVKLAPDNAQAHLSLADVCRRQRDYDQAAAEYAQAAPTLKGDFFARHWHGLMLLRAGQETEGVSHLFAALKLAQEKGEHYVSRTRGLALNEKFTYVKIWGGRYFEADVDYVILDALDRLRAAPNNPVARCDLATAYANLEVYDVALRYADQGLAQAPDMLEAHFVKGRALLGLGNLEEAQAELDRVLQENPLHPRVYITMARAALAAGQPAKAQQYLLQHRKNYPEDDLTEKIQKQ